MPTQDRYEITISESGFNDDGIYTSQTKTLVVDSHTLIWYKYNSGKALSNGDIFYLIDTKRLVA